MDLNKRNLSSVQKTLNRIDFAKFSDNIIKKIAPIAKKNEKVRAKSLQKPLVLY